MGMTCDLYLLSELECNRAVEDDAFVDAWLEERSWWDEDSKLDRDRSDSLDKVWHVIHYALTGLAWPSQPSPLSFLVNGGVECGNDQGYGSPRLFSPREVARIVTDVSVIQHEDCRERLQNVPEDIYLRSMLSDDDGFEEIWGRITDMKKLFEKNPGAGLLVVVA
tara:strand:+ start:325 stop:819 length:495 start_codon:yes stop_codon:yes gene_type:complete